MREYAGITVLVVWLLSVPLLIRVVVSLETPSPTAGIVALAGYVATYVLLGVLIGVPPILAIRFITGMRFGGRS